MMNPTPAAEREPIPIDILEPIIALLARPEQVKCLRVSRLFYNLIAPKIYTRVDIDLSEDLNPLFDRRKAKKSWTGGKSATKGHHGSEASTILDLLGKITKPSVQPPRSSPLPESAHRRWPIPHRFSFTTHLTISSHSRPICTQVAPLIMPNLISLHIKPTFQENDLNVCHCSHGMNHRNRSICSCPLLAHLRPRQVIIGGDCTGLAGVAMGLWPKFPPVWVKELIVYAGSCSGIEIGSKGTSGRSHSDLLPNLPASIDKLVVIMQPRTGFEASPRWRFRRVAGIEGDLDDRLIWEALGRAICGKARKVEVVGVELIDRDWTKMTVDAEKAAVRKALVWRLDKQGIKEHEALKRAGEIVFTERKVYDERVWGWTRQ